MSKDAMFFGVDLSMNHGAVASVCSSDSDYYFFEYFTDKKKDVIETDTIIGSYLPPYNKKKESRSAFIGRRREFVCTFLYNSVLRIEDKTDVDIYVCLEDYAFSARSNSITSIAELTGIFKKDLYDYEIPLRLHAPTCVKKWATGKGKAKKREMFNHFMHYSKFVIPPALFTETKSGLDGVGTDLVDAFYLLDMMRTEWLVREGRLSLESLAENKRQEFLRVTKSNPENVLVREWDA